jgi:FtsP/CotA-like multicopper oxidase with cupredoxin domain
MQDGFPCPHSPPIADGAVEAYDYAPIPGTYWMHSHHGLQEQSLLTAPLIVRDVAELREDRQDVVSCCTTSPSDRRMRCSPS